MEQLPPPQEKELPSPHEKLLRSPTFWERQGKASKWLAIGSIIFFVLLLISTLLLRLLKSTITQPTQPKINAIEISSDQKSILNAETKEVVFTIADAQKYLKNSGYFYNPDTFQTTNAKYEGNCFDAAALSNKKGRIVFSASCLPGDLPQAWVGVVYEFPKSGYKTNNFCGYNPNDTKFSLIASAFACFSPARIKFLTAGSGRNFVWSQDDATITYEADLGLSGLTETRTIDSNTGEIIKKKNSPVTSNLDTTNWKTYKNEKYGFEIKYPQNWIPHNLSSNGIIFRIGLWSKDCSIDCGSMEISVISTTNKSFQQIKQETENESLSRLSPQDIPFKETIIDEERAFIFPAYEHLLGSVTVVHEGYIYNISRWYSEKDIPEELFNQALSAFKFLDQVPN